MKEQHVGKTKFVVFSNNSRLREGDVNHKKDLGAVIRDTIVPVIIIGLSISLSLYLIIPGAGAA